MDQEPYNTEGEISLTDIWNIVKRRWSLIAIITLVFVLASFAYVNQLQPLFRSTATLIVQTPSSSGSMFSNPLPDYTISERWTQTYAEMLKGEPILEEVSKRTQFPRISTNELRGGLTVEAVRNTLLLKVSFTYHMKTYAKKITDTVCNVFIENITELYQSNIQSSTMRLENQINQLENDIDLLVRELSVLSTSNETYPSKKEELESKQELRGILFQQYQTQKINESQLLPSVRIFQHGTEPQAPINKKFQLTMAIGFVLGLFVSLLLAFFLEYLDDSIKTEEDLKKLTNSRILGVIPFFGSKAESYYMGKYSRYYLKE
jgi:capsular polysaccharide biosynthesis protein